VTFYILKPCQGKAAFEVLLRSQTQIDFPHCVPTLQKNGYDVTDAGVMIVAKKGKVEISIFPSAKLLIKCQSKEDAAGIANEIYGLLGVPGPL
jgi:hypothetical protein